MTDSVPQINVQRFYYPPPSNAPSFPGLVIQITTLVDTYMIWIGATDPEGMNQGSRLMDDEENAEHDMKQKIESVISRGRIARDWGCAMPSAQPSITDNAGAWLYRSNESEASVGMAQRLARRLRKAVYVSIDIDGKGDARVLLEAERRLVEVVGSRNWN